MVKGMVSSFLVALVSYISQISPLLPSLSTLSHRKSHGVVQSSRTAIPAVFRRQDSEGAEAGPLEEHHAKQWWATSGFALAVLLDKAGYSTNAQSQLLRFVRAIMPSLGPSPVTGTTPHWKSFMTDNHIPIELSWDWRTKDQTPKIRFSIEPVGLHAGTPTDPNNDYAASVTRDAILRFMPETNMDWLRHFQTQLDGAEDKLSSAMPEGHMSREFYAFDLNRDGSIMTKAYLFPGYKAKATQQTNLDVVMSAIRTAPNSSPEKLSALRVFQEYVLDTESPALEMDMLAIDLVQPSDSRFKIYFRIRDTSFASVRNTLTLGNRMSISTPEAQQAMEDLQQLYHSLGTTISAEDGASAEHSQLRAKEHRTSGILYNAEFKYGSREPKVKAYLPVRHFAQSEQAVISAIGAHFERTQTGSSWRPNMANYMDALKIMLPGESLRSLTGMHTYLGCSVEENAGLRLVSYLNPLPATSRDARQSERK